jgi:abortive infection bacteriophage resistance protein
MEFNKPPKTFQEQLELLIERGLIVNNIERALHYLSHLNYYRLEAFLLPFEVSRNPHQFAKDTHFEQILNHYLFDRELRLHLLDAIERIEVSFRTQWAYHLSHAYGTHAHLIDSKGVSKKSNWYRANIEDLKEHIERSDEPFIKHFRETYDEELPPAWVSCEVMSLGLLSRFYSNLRANKVRNAIAATYQVDEKFLEGFMEHLSYVRNVCAHHSRLWNRHLSKKMPLPKGKPSGIRDNIFIDEIHKTEHKLYNTLVLIQHILTLICADSHWAKSLELLISKYGIDVKHMGFPEDWKNRPLWQHALNNSNH